MHVGEDSEDFRGDSEILVRISISGGDFDWIIIPLKIFTFSPCNFIIFPSKNSFSPDGDFGGDFRFLLETQ